MASVCSAPAVRSRSRVSAELSELAVVRDALVDALASHGWSGEEAFRVLICADEAMANALTHTSGSDSGIDVRYRVDARHVMVAVGHGCHCFAPFSRAPIMPAHSCEHGRGLILMRAFADEFHVWSRPAATVVALGFRRGSRIADA